MRLTRTALAMLFGVAVGSAAAADRALVIGVNDDPGIAVGGLAGQKDLGGAVFEVP